MFSGLQGRILAPMPCQCQPIQKSRLTRRLLLLLSGFVEESPTMKISITDDFYRQGQIHFLPELDITIDRLGIEGELKSIRLGWMIYSIWFERY